MSTVFHALSDDVLFVRADSRFGLFLLSVRRRSLRCGARNLGEAPREPPRNVRDRGMITLVLGTGSTQEDEKDSILLVSFCSSF